MDDKYHGTSLESTEAVILFKNAQEDKPVTTALGVIPPLLHREYPHTWYAGVVWK